MIVVTGGAGFIGSAMVWKLNAIGRKDILIVDELGTSEKWKNLVPLYYSDYLDKNDFLELIMQDDFDDDIQAIIHMGANSSTTEKDAAHLMENNYRYTKHLAEYCLDNDIRFVYASSAATYGDGSKGFKDKDEDCLKLRPLNMYGYSKNLFDQWAYNTGAIKEIAGIKFFNVYGPNEYHKGDMRSVVVKAYEQILETGKVNLFKSDRENYADGEQMRDFVYVKDAVEAIFFLLKNKDVNGLYNVGSGKARTWNALVTAIYSALEKVPNIEYIDMPEHLKSKYQYFTEANLTKLKNAGYSNEMHTLEDGVLDYVRNYLVAERHLGDE